MNENKSSISKQTTYAGIAEYWDTHELDESFFEGEDLEVEVDLSSRKYYFAIDEELIEEVSEIAAKDGVDRTKLLNRWIREKVKERQAA